MLKNPYRIKILYGFFVTAIIVKISLNKKENLEIKRERERLLFFKSPAKNDL
jgi:hypothetical protein